MRVEGVAFDQTDVVTVGAGPTSFRSRARARGPSGASLLAQQSVKKIIRPAAVRAGIKKRIGWHTLRHTYSTTLNC
jgi:site-specific recombinase XerC